MELEYWEHDEKAWKNKRVLVHTHNDIPLYWVRVDILWGTEEDPYIVEIGKEKYSAKKMPDGNYKVNVRPE